MLKPGTGEALEIPATFMDFHNQELIEYQDAVLAVQFYREWEASGGKSPAFDQCVGYQKPLFFGGSDTIQNLELTDIDVYWSVVGQLLHKVRDIPEGTRVGNVRIKD